ncbi:hypothetical protein PPERSA_01142 [Pseudocohnilembus persalinus]|uniref:TLDc domain-containing protein n=1 Tax=Pseudocohnilembus persalinus TaxID=266149 RepID=A0A0V0QVN6_PSEPJ|nr:hypothetical protein PPERSA_01142 [Pseudocohnilembus persalinus]|eukprot:KRX06064.1 hypothetical protein PPERSA_01142 [Pseudocohnilembus persalinus]
MSIIYTLIARGQNTILVDYSQAAGNFPQEIYNQDPNSDKLNKLKQELYQVKDIMVENIEEKKQKTDNLDDQEYNPQQFQNNQNEFEYSNYNTNGIISYGEQNNKNEQNSNQGIKQTFIERLEKIEKFDVVFTNQYGTFPGLLSICPGQIWFDPYLEDYKKLEKDLKKLGKKLQRKFSINDFQISININDLDSIDYRKEFPHEFVDIILNGISQNCQKKSINEHVIKSPIQHYRVTFMDNIDTQMIKGFTEDQYVTQMHYIMQKLHHHICKFKNIDKDYQPQSELYAYDIVNLKTKDQILDQLQQQQKNQGIKDQEKQEHQIYPSIIEDTKFTNISSADKQNKNSINEGDEYKNQKEDEEKMKKQSQRNEQSRKNDDNCNNKTQEKEQQQQKQQQQQQQKQQIEQHQSIQRNRYNIIKPKYYPKLMDSSSIINQQQFENIVDFLPPYYQYNNWHLVFSPNKNGYSYQVFLRMCDEIGPHVIICEDMKGNIFGGFAADGWRVVKNFYGSPECFLYSFYNKEDSQKKKARDSKNEENENEDKKQKNRNDKIYYYPWSGNNYNIQYCDQDGFSLGVGVRFGLYINSGFMEGSSEESTTFSTPGSLTTKTDFKLFNFEIYGVSPGMDKKIEQLKNQN